MRQRFAAFATNVALDGPRNQLRVRSLLWQNVAKSTSPQDVVAAQAGFWQEAIADYWQEYATMSKLLAGITGNVM